MTGLNAHNGVAAFFRDQRVLSAITGPRSDGATPLINEFLSRFTYADCTVGQLLALADLAARSGNAEVTERALRQVVASGAKLHLAYYKLGRMYLSQGKAADAADHFDLGVEADPQFAYNYMGAARARHVQGLKKDAAPFAIRFAQFGVRPHGHEDFTILGDLADLLFDSGQRPDALPIYALIKSFGVQKPRHVVRLAEDRMAAGAHEEALAMLLEQTRRGGPDPWSSRALAVCYSQRGDHAEAISHALLAVQSNPANASFVGTYVRIIGKSGDPAAIREVLDTRASMLTPADLAELNTRLCLIGEDYEGAAAILMGALVVPDSRLFYLSVEAAYAALTAGLYAVAEELGAMLESVSPGDLSAKVLHIDTLFRQLRWEEAGAVLATVPQVPGERPQLTMKRLEYACFTADRETQAASAAQLEILSAGNKQLMLPVFRYLAEEQDWNGVVERALPWLDGSLNYKQIGYVLFRAAKHSGRQADMLQAIHAVPGWDGSAGLAILRNTLAVDLANTVDAVDALLDDPAITDTATRAKLSIRRDVLAQAAGTAGRHAVFLCTDRNYLCATIVALYSLTQHADARTTDFFVVADDAIVPLTQDAVQAFSAHGFTVTVVPASCVVSSMERLSAAYGLFTSGHRLASAAYYRIYFARYLRALGRHARAVYVDSDVLLNAPLDTLLRLDMDGHPLAARLELPRPEVSRAIAQHRLADGQYFNSGVLLIDLQHDGLDAALDGAVQAITDEKTILLYHDQCALNLGFRDCFSKLDLTWNHPVTESARLDDIPADTALLHFLERPKPWSAAYNGEAGPMWFTLWRETAAFIGEAVALKIFGEITD